MNPSRVPYLLSRVTLLMLAVASLLAVMGAGAQGRDVEILSKADAVQLFAMPRSQWEQNVARAMGTGAARAAPRSKTGMVGMMVRTPDGLVTTRLEYPRGEARPASIHVFVVLTQAQLTESRAREVIEAAQRQLAPEFDVKGDMEPVPGGVSFFFTITERLDPATPK